jgi:CheY-like chemotaxis protein
METLAKYRLENVLEGVTVLLTEDDPMNQFIAKKFLTKWGLDITVANNGQEAIDLIQSKKFQIVLMDIHMPVMDGTEAVRRIRAMEDSYFQTVPIIAFSAVIEEKEEALEMGMNDFTTKPINPADLQAKIIQYHLKTKVEDPGQRKLFIDFDVYTDGDDGFKHELITLMVGNLEELNITILNTRSNEDQNELHRITHKVKATLAMLNDCELSEIISVLEVMDVNEIGYKEVKNKFLNLNELVIANLRSEAEAANKGFALVRAKAA